MNRILRLIGILALLYLAASIAVWISDELAWQRWQQRAGQITDSSDTTEVPT